MLSSNQTKCKNISCNMNTKNKSNLTCKNCRATDFCSHQCLIEHSLKCTNKKKEKEKYEIHSNSNQTDYFFYKNFFVVKIDNKKQLLGKGIYSEVFLVKSKTDGKNYAMKIIDKRKVKDLKMLVMEIKIHSNLKNENITKLFSYSETTDFLYVILEHAENGSLSFILKEKESFDEEFTRKLVRDTLNAVDYLHQKGVSHGNLLLDNILVTKEYKVKLTDFKYLNTQSMENFERNKIIDIWSLGHLLFKSLYGYFPLDVRYII